MELPQCYCPPPSILPLYLWTNGLGLAEGTVLWLYGVSIPGLYHRCYLFGNTSLWKSSQGRGKESTHTHLHPAPAYVS
jgi:hypothetical protein